MIMTILYGVVFTANLLVLVVISSKLDTLADVMREIANDVVLLRRSNIPDPDIAESSTNDIAANDARPSEEGLAAP